MTHKTMNVGQLIEHLNQYDDDVLVVAQWEGCMAAIQEGNFSTYNEMLVIDVEDYNIHGHGFDPINDSE